MIDADAFGWGVFPWHLPTVVAAATAAAGAWLYAVHVRRERAGLPAVGTRRALLLLACFAVAVVWPLRVPLKLRPAIHYWDIAHHYLGAKYFPELGYDSLYDCIAAADLQDGVSRAESGKVIRDLRSNVLQRPLLISAESCPAFSADRWGSFRRDVAFFREHVAQAHDPGRWARMKRDHGFNATPAWIAAGRVLTAFGDASEGRIVLLVSLDLLLLVAAGWLAFRAFGPVPAALALLFWATNEPARFAWTSLAFLRHGWLFCTVAGICCLRRARHGLAGGFLALAALLRIFPGLLLAGLFAREAGSMLRRRSIRPTAGFVPLAAAAAGTLAAGVLVGGFASGGPEAWEAYARRAATYTRTSMANSMGLKTLTYVASPARFDRLRRQVAVEAGLPDGGAGDAVDAAQTWREARARLFRDRRPYYLAALGGLWALALWRTRRPNEPEDWAAAAVFAGCALVTSELPSYYTALLLTSAFLAPRRPALGVGLLGYAAVSRLLPLVFDLESRASLVSSALAVGVVLLSISAAGRVRGRPD